nr:MAG TPA: H type lectin domain protein [Caudoviricetes sp.]
MALIDNKITTWTNPIVNEADRPQRSAADMKAIFDSNSNQLKTALNNLIDALTASGAGDIGAKVEGMSGTTIGTLLTELKSLIDDICDDLDALQSAVLPGNDGTLFLADNGEWKLPSVGAAANGVVAGGAAGSLYVKKSQKVYDAEWKSGHDLGLMFASTYDTDNDGVVDKADDADKLGGKAASEYQPAGTYAAPAKAKIVSLTIANWTGTEAPFQQTVSIEGATDTNIKVISPAPASIDEYASCGVKATTEGTGTITFACAVVPENALTVNVVILG